MSKNPTKALFYISGSKLMELGVSFKGSAVEFGKPQALFNMPSSVAPQGASDYTVSPDGKRFLTTTLPEGNSPGPLTRVTNWTAELKKQ